MTTLGSWIDTETVSGLGRDLAAPAGSFSSPEEPAPGLPRLSPADFHPPDDGPPEPFPGPESGGRDKARAMLSEVRRRAEASGLLSRPGEPPRPDPAPPADAVPPLNRSIPYFTPPAGPLATRLRAFLEWLRRQVVCQESFIVDHQGNPASDREAPAELVTAGILMAGAGRHALRHIPAAAGGAVHLDLPGERKLCIVDAATAAGPFFLGLVLTEALTARAADRLRRALQRTIEAEPATVIVQQRAERW